MSTSWLNSVAIPRQKKMAKAKAKADTKQTFFDEELPPNVHIEEAQESDDFVVIDMIGEKDASSIGETSHDSGYEDFVELSVEDAVLEEGGDSKPPQKRCLYGIRLFQYSEESEGNIFIRNEDL